MPQKIAVEKTPKLKKSELLALEFIIIITVFTIIYTSYMVLYYNLS